MANSSRKRRDEWRSAIHKSEHDACRVAHLAANKMAEMARLTAQADRDGPDWKLCSALRLAVAPFPKRERGRFAVAAFRTFNADRELQGSCGEIAARWLNRAGYPRGVTSIDMLDRTAAAGRRTIAS